VHGQSQANWGVAIRKAKTDGDVEVTMANSPASKPFLVQFAIVLLHLPHLMHNLALFVSIWANCDEDDEKISRSFLPSVGLTRAIKPPLLRRKELAESVGGGACQVAVAPVMDAAAVQARFDE